MTDTEVLVFDSHSPYSSPLSYDDCQEFQSTAPFDYTIVPDSPVAELFDDTMVLDSPVAEPFDDTMVLDSPVVDPFNKMDFNNQVVNYAEFVEVGLQATGEPEYDMEVVPDSEDEGVDGTKSLCVGNSVNLRKRRHRPMQKRVGGRLPDCHSIIDQECHDTGLDTMRTNQCNDDPIESQVPGEIDQASALAFVEHFVAVNAVNISPSIVPTKITRIRTPPVSKTKGIQTLAKRISTNTSARRWEIFDWVDDEKCGGDDSPKDIGDACFGDGDLRLDPKDKFPKTVEDKVADCMIGDSEEEKETVDLHENIDGSIYSTSGFGSNSPIESYRIHEVCGKNDKNQFIEGLDELLQDKVTEQDLGAIADVFDVGINTQIAAEAMGALLYASTTGCHSTASANECPRKSIENSPRDLMKSKPSSQENFCGKISNFPFKGIAIKPYKKKRSARKYVGGNINPPLGNSDHQELNPCMFDTSKAKRKETLSTGKTRGRRVLKKNESPGMVSCKVFEHRKLEGAAGSNSSKESAIQMPSSLPAKHVSHGKGHSEYFSHLAKGCIKRGRSVAAKDQLSSKEKRNNNVLERVYSRKKRGISAAPSEFRDGKMSKFSQNEESSPQVAAITNLKYLNTWNFAKGKRSSRKQVVHLNAAINQDALIKDAGRKKSDICSNRKVNDQPIGYNSRTKQKSQSISTDTWNFPKGKRSRRNGVVHLNVAINQDALIKEAGTKESDICSNRSVNDPPTGYNSCTKELAQSMSTGLFQLSGESDSEKSFIRQDTWGFPKGKRSNRKGVVHLNAAINQNALIKEPCRKESNICSNISVNDQPSGYNSLTKEKVQSTSTGLFQLSGESDSKRSFTRQNLDEPAPNIFIQSRKLDTKDFSSVNGAETQNEPEAISNKNVVPFVSKANATLKHHKLLNSTSVKYTREGKYPKPCNTNVPKLSLVKELTRLGVSRTAVDYTWRDLRKRRDMAYIRVLFSQHLDKDILKQQKKIIARLGISIVSSPTDATHFIANRFVRTRNMLEAISLGVLVVTHLWLESCGQASCLIDEKSYILRDSKKEKEIGFSMPCSLARANQSPLLKGRKVFITQNIKPQREMISSLVKAVHGQVVEMNQISVGKDKTPHEDLLILSCEEDKEICRLFLDRGAAVYSTELLLNGIVIQKLEYNRHRLFTNGGKRNQPYSRSKIH